MKKTTRAMYSLALIAGFSTVFGSSVLFSIPNAAYADDASSTPNSNASSTPSTPSPTLTSLTFSFGAGLTNGQNTGDNPIPVTATFSAAVTGFSASSLNIGNGTVHDFTTVSPTNYTFNIVPSAPTGTVSIDSNDPGVKDGNGNIALAAPQIFVIFDSTLTNNTGDNTGSSTATSTDNGSGNGSGNNSGGNGGSNTSSTTPLITWISGPADGSTVSTSTVTFEFSIDPSATATCSFGSVTATYGCGSPQTFTNLVDGVYPFTIFAVSSSTSASSTRTFTIDLEAASSTDATSTDSSTSTPSDTSGSSSSDSSNVDNSGGSSGTEGQIVATNNSPSTGGGTNGGSSDSTVVTTPVVTPTSTFVPDTTGAGSSDVDQVPAGNLDDALTSNTATVTDAAAAPDNAATNTQPAAANVAGTSSTVLWAILILLILAIGGVSIWSYTRNRQG